MNIAINFVPAGANACNIKNHQVKKTNTVLMAKTNEVNLTKLSNYYYQSTFMGATFNPINSKRSHIDYGENLYIGAYDPPDESNERYSVIRDKAKAEGYEFNGNDLSNYSFAKSILVNANLNGCKLENVNFENSNMSGCKLKGIKTKSTNFANTNLCNADLSGAIFTFKSAENLDLRGAKYDRDTVFNSDFDPQEHGMEDVFEAR